MNRGAHQLRQRPGNLPIGLRESVEDQEIVMAGQHAQAYGQVQRICRLGTGVRLPLQFAQLITSYEQGLRRIITSQ